MHCHLDLGIHHFAANVYEFRLLIQ
jgi:hypothetical protein